MISFNNGEKSLKIDIHTHIMPEKMPRWSEKFGYGGFIHLEKVHREGCNCARMMMDDKFFREIESNCWEPIDRLHDCEKHNVDVQVLSTIPVLFNYSAKAEHAHETSRFLNDHIAEICANHSKRFIGLATLPMQDTNLAIKELERSKKELNLAGVEIGTHINNINLNDESLFPFFEAAAELDMAIFVHPWEMMGENDMKRYWLPWLVGMPAESSRAICSMIFGGVFERLPYLRVCFAHGGGSFPATIGRIEHGFNVRPDLVAIDNSHNPKEYLGNFWLDSLTHDEKMLSYIIELMGEDKIALGTDYPFPLGELEPGELIESTDYSNILKQKLLYKNALNWLNLDEKHFW